MVINKVRCTNGEIVSFEETPYYYKLTIGKKTWYWGRDTGKFDGTSFAWKKDPEYAKYIK